MQVGSYEQLGMVVGRAKSNRFSWEETWPAGEELGATVVGQRKDRCEGKKVHVGYGGFGVKTGLRGWGVEADRRPEYKRRRDVRAVCRR